MVSIKFSTGLENKNKFDFLNTLNHFIFQKFIPYINDIEHYKPFFRNQNMEGPDKEGLRKDQTGVNIALNGLGTVGTVTDGDVRDQGSENHYQFTSKIVKTANFYFNICCCPDKNRYF